MSFFIKYVKSNRLFIGAVFVMCIIFSLSFFAYGLPAAAFVYPSILSVILMICIFIYGAIREKVRHNMVRDAMLRRELIDETMLPRAFSCVEEDFHELVKLLQEERMDAITSVNTKCNQLSEYYTLWVHQIKTPIASMKLKVSGMDNEMGRLLNSDLLRIEQYVDMVMTYVRLDSKTSDYNFRRIKLDELIKQNIRKFSNDFINKKLKLQYDRTEAEVLTDEKWLGFVIEQLLANAVKYTQKGTVTIAALSEGEKVRIQIKDTGIGISSENIPRLFELGFTGYNGRIDNRASGIGLYLCKRICDNLGIEINITSVVGEGTCVELIIDQNVT